MGINYRLHNGQLIENINDVDYTIGDTVTINSKLSGLYSQLETGADVAGRIALFELRLEKLQELTNADG